jgi:hypothetical protein
MGKPCNYKGDIIKIRLVYEYLCQTLVSI